MKKCRNYIAWFLSGQIVQIVLHIISFRVSRPIGLCCSAGFLIAFAIGIGMFVAGKERTPDYDNLVEEGSADGQHVR